MNLNDFFIKAQIHTALALDSRVSMLDTSVHVTSGEVTLEGMAESAEAVQAAGDIAGRVDGVQSIRNLMGTYADQKSGTIEMLQQRLLTKLEEEWNGLPDHTAVVQADYLRWALWMIHQFRVPADVLLDRDIREARAMVVEEALSYVAKLVHAPKALLALWMMQMAQTVSQMESIPVRDMNSVPYPESTAVVEGLASAI